MSKNREIAEERIDKEIARRNRGGYMYTYHITGIGRKINGITVVSESRLDYENLLTVVTDISYRLDEKHKDVFPGDLKLALTDLNIGVAICDHRDQFDRNEGRMKAKRSWLRMNPRNEPK